MRAVLLAIAMMLVATPPAMAEGAVFVPEALKFFEAGSLKFSDQVSGGCLPSSNSAKNAAELELRRSGFLVVPGSRPNILIVFIGSQLSPALTCAAAFKLELWDWTRVDDRMLWAEKNPYIDILIYSITGVIVGPKSRFQNQVEEVSAELARDFVLEWLRLRQDAE